LDPRYNKGLVLAELGRYEDAIESYNDVIALDDNHAAAWYNKGIALKALDRITEADSAFAKAKERGYVGRF
jgi:tetratricopeptide (TPR) repeat protein